MEEHSKKILEIYSKYSFHDIATSLFVLNLFLPNVASPIKSQYLYVLLAHAHTNLNPENQINTYTDFAEFVNSVLPLVPDFPMSEDYVPEADWGEISYRFGDKDHKLFYRVFYGGDLSNPYEYFYSFEVIFSALEELAASTTTSSPLNDLKSVLKIQDQILTSITQEVSESIEETLTPGYLGLPCEAFWLSVEDFLNTFIETPVLSDATLVKDLDQKSTEISFNERDFENMALRGEILPYLYLVKNGKTYPILPRKYLSVLYKRWNDFYLKHPEEIKDQSEKISRQLI